MLSPITALQPSTVTLVPLVNGHEGCGQNHFDRSFGADGGGAVGMAGLGAGLVAVFHSCLMYRRSATAGALACPTAIFSCFVGTPSPNTSIGHAKQHKNTGASFVAPASRQEHAVPSEDPKLKLEAGTSCIVGI